jgi:hypothetical protein
MHRIYRSELIHHHQVVSSGTKKLRSNIGIGIGIGIGIDGNKSTAWHHHCTI